MDVQIYKEVLSVKGYEKDILKVFDVGRKMGLVAKGNKSYQEAVMRAGKWLHENLGGKDAKLTHWKGGNIEKYIDHLVDRYNAGTISADSIHKTVHALEKARLIVKETQCLGKNNGKSRVLRTGLKEERLEKLNELGVIRAKSEITAKKSEIHEAKQVIGSMAGVMRNTRTGSNVDRNKETILDIANFQLLTGSRITAAVNLKMSDVDLKNNVVTFNKDKNGFTRRVPLTSEARDFLQSRIDNARAEGKKEDSPLFEMKDRNNNTMNKQKSAKLVQEQTKKGAEAAGIYKQDSRFNTHSYRKAYAQNVYDGTKGMSAKQLHKMIGEHLQRQGSNKERVAARLQKEMERINKYNKYKNRFSIEQLRCLVVSLYLGHSRIDVVQRNYIVTDKERAKMKSVA